MQDKDNYSGLFYTTALQKHKLPLWWWVAIIVAAGLLSFCFTRFVLGSTHHTNLGVNALQQTGYTKIHLIGERRGVCGLDQEIVYALTVTDSIPKINRKDSYDTSCFFVDRFVAKDAKGVVQTGTIYCGPMVKLSPPFADCNIFDDVSLGVDNQEEQTPITQNKDINI